jgi:prolyl-tRNA synthetase
MGIASTPWQAGLVPACITLDERKRSVKVRRGKSDYRPGFKFKDADLIGVPLRVVIVERGLKQGQLELKWRWESAPEMIPVEGAAGRIAELVREESATG